jgi:hypothetical protein
MTKPETLWLALSLQALLERGDVDKALEILREVVNESKTKST